MKHIFKSSFSGLSLVLLVFGCSAKYPSEVANANLIGKNRLEVIFECRRLMEMGADEHGWNVRDFYIGSIACVKETYDDAGRVVSSENDWISLDYMSKDGASVSRYIDECLERKIVKESTKWTWFDMSMRSPIQSMLCDMNPLTWFDSDKWYCPRKRLAILFDDSGVVTNKCLETYLKWDS
jgi:hypothetical protein